MTTAFATGGNVDSGDASQGQVRTGYLFASLFFTGAGMILAAISGYKSGYKPGLITATQYQQVTAINSLTDPPIIYLMFAVISLVIASVLINRSARAKLRSITFLRWLFLSFLMLMLSTTLGVAPNLLNNRIAQDNWFSQTYDVKSIDVPDENGAFSGVNDEGQTVIFNYSMTDGKNTITYMETK